MPLYHMLFKMKNNWINTQPNGRAPPINELTKGCVIHVCSGISRGIWLVRTGWLMGCVQFNNKMIYIFLYLHLYGNQKMLQKRSTEQKYQTYNWSWEYDDTLHKDIINSPEAKQSQQCRKWNSCGWLVWPQDQVEEEENTKHNSRIEKSCR